jgi:hypothetical protein
MVVAKNAFIDSSEGPPKGRQWARIGVVAAVGARVELGEKLEEICLYALRD